MTPPIGTTLVALPPTSDRDSEAQVEQSVALVTALNPHIGHDAAAKAARRTLEEGKTVREVAVGEGYHTEPGPTRCSNR